MNSIRETAHRSQPLKIVALAIVCAGCGIVAGSSRPTQPQKSDRNELERTLDAICQVESSGGLDRRDGDGGRAIGPYQIHRAYWQDGTRILGVRWPYEDARDHTKARAVVRAYVTHYQRIGHHRAGPQTWARIQNGGPRGAIRGSTLPYWRKIESWMMQQRNIVARGK